MAIAATSSKQLTRMKDPFSVVLSEREAHRLFEVIAAPDLSVVAYRYCPKSGDQNEFNRHLIRSIVVGKELFISSTVLRGRFALRACILSFRTHQTEVEDAFETIRTGARRLAAV